MLVFTDGDDTASKKGMGDVLDKRARRRGDDLRDRPGVRVLQRAATDAADAPDRGLRKLADETGGGYFELKKTAELAPTFTRVAQELHSLYTLGFTPTVLDGKEHRLEVRDEAGRA